MQGLPVKAASVHLLGVGPMHYKTDRLSDNAFDRPFYQSSYHFLIELSVAPSDSARAHVYQKPYRPIAKVIAKAIAGKYDRGSDRGVIEDMIDDVIEVMGVIEDMIEGDRGYDRG